MEIKLNNIDNIIKPQIKTDTRILNEIMHYVKVNMSVDQIHLKIIYDLIKNNRKKKVQE